jgi:hypothetical protein
MDQDHDFSALCNLLALKRLDLPQDTQIDEFLTEFHRRQRAQLLVRRSIGARAVAWTKERIAGMQLVPSLSYASAVAAIAITVFVSLSQQVQVTQVDGKSELTFRMPTHDSSFALMPGSLIPASTFSSKTGDSPNFSPTRTDSSATRYVLATNSHGAYDATVAF